jgi:hypothetical protein
VRIPKRQSPITIASPIHGPLYHSFSRTDCEVISVFHLLIYHWRFFPITKTIFQRQVQYPRDLFLLQPMSRDRISEILLAFWNLQLLLFKMTPSRITGGWQLRASKKSSADFPEACSPNIISLQQNKISFQRVRFMPADDITRCPRLNKRKML